MSQKSIALRQERANLIKQSRELTDRADNEKRDMTQEERNSYSAWFKAQGDLKVKIEEEEALEAAEKEMRSAVGTETRPVPQGDGNRAAGGAQNAMQKRPEEMTGLELIESSVRSTPEYREAFDRYFMSGDKHEFRSFGAGSLTQAGVLVPVEVMKGFLKFVDNAVILRQKATVIPLPNALKMQIPEWTTDPDEPDTVTEFTVGTEDTAAAMGARYLEPHPKSKSFKMSRDLLRMGLGINGMSIQEFIMSRLGYIHGVHDEKKFMLGTGFQEALGLFVANVLGIPTSRDKQSGSTTGPTFDGLKGCKYNLKDQYRVVAEWLFNRSMLEFISKIKDGEGRYQWQDSVKEGEPDRLLGHPVMSSEYAPSTNTTGQYIGMFADFSQYWIADAYDLEIQPLYELSARTNQVEFISRKSCDGRPAMAEAFSRLINN